MELLLTLYALVVLKINADPIPSALQQLKKKLLKYKDTLPSLDYVSKQFLKGDQSWGNLPAELKEFVKIYAKDPDSLSSITSLLKAFSTFLLTGSERAFKHLETTAANPKFPPWISQNMLTKTVDQDPVNRKLRVLVRKMIGKSQTSFDDPDQAAAAKMKFPNEYKQWQVLRKEHLAAWKSELANFVHASHKKTVPYPALVKYLAKKGIEHTMPLGFTGNIDAAGKWYSPFDEELTGVPSTVIFPKVRMNPDYHKGSTEYVAVAIRKDGTEGGYIYTGSTRQANTLKKFQKVEDFSHIIKAVRTKWTQLILKGDPEDKVTVAAVVLELLFQFSARIGSRPQEHNGVSSLMLSQITLKENGFILKYLGKDKVPTKHVFTVNGDKVNKRVYEIVKLLATAPDKSKKDFLFTYRLLRGRHKPVVAGIVTRTFRRCGAQGLSVHKLRTYHATELMKAELTKVYAKRTKFASTKEAFEILKKLALKVGKDLNHVRRNALGETTVTPTTALANYIDVSLQVSFFQHYGLPVPKYLEKYVADPSRLMSSTMVMASDDPTEDESQEHAEDDEKQHDEDESDREAALSEEDRETQEKLERSAEKVSQLLTQGGRNSGNYSTPSGQFDNVLI